jgi:hypothetical protein
MRKQLCSGLLLALTVFCLSLPVNTSQGQNASKDENTAKAQKDKAKKCEETGKKKGLKGDELSTFVSTCLAAKDTASSATPNMSPQDQQKADKAKSCEQQADQQGLKGKARAKFIKTCTGA